MAKLWMRGLIDQPDKRKQFPAFFCVPYIMTLHYLQTWGDATEVELIWGVEECDGDDTAEERDNGQLTVVHLAVKQQPLC